jgi:hypothetical protein
MTLSTSWIHSTLPFWGQDIKGIFLGVPAGSQVRNLYKGHQDMIFLLEESRNPTGAQLVLTQTGDDRN